MKCRTKTVDLRLNLYGFLKERRSSSSVKISFKFTDKVLFFDDLSVNFCPLCWGFTDKRLFSEHLSVKPGPKRLNSYGQTAIFDHFVRNRHFSSEPFTDKVSIFIDLSVNGSDFDKCSARQISAPSSHSNLTPASFRRLSCIRKKPD